MPISKSALFYFLSIAGVAAGDTLASVGDGGEEKMSFSLSYTNIDGSICTPCVFCEGSALHNTFDPNVGSLCMSCANYASCDQAIITNSFQKAWGMTYASLASDEGDASFDPDVISIEASDDYDEGSKTGTWSTLASSSTSLVYKTRNAPQDIVFGGNVMHSHYRIIFRRKDNSDTMKIGNVGSRITFEHITF